MSGSAFNLLDPEHLRDPHPLYSQIQQEAPVYWFEPGQFWFLTRYDDVASVLRDSSRFSSKRNNEILSSQVPAELMPGFAPMMQLFSRWFLFMDPPEHTRLRGLVGKAFVPRVVEGMRPEVERITHQLIAPMRQAGRADIVKDFAVPLPVSVITRLLGVPFADSPLFRQWSDAVIHFLGIASPDLTVAQRAQQAVLGMADYFGQLIRERRRAPKEDLASRMLDAAREMEGAVDEDTLVATCALLLVAGHGTTQSLIGNGILLLLQHPEQARKLRENPALLKTAIEEILRCEPPGQTFGRTAKEDVEMGGQRIRTGQQVLVSLAAANRDPSRFVAPQHFDVERVDNPHLSFSAGVHFCAGAALARMEAHVAFTALLPLTERMQMEDEQPQWLAQDLAARGLRGLQVRFAP